MTAITEPHTRPEIRHPNGAIVAAGTGATALLLAGLYLDTPWKKEGDKEWALTTDDYGLTDLLISLAFVAVGLAVVYGVAVSRGRRRTPGAENRWSLALAVTGALSVFVFWTGLPVILTSGALVLSLDSRARLGRTPATGWIVYVLAALTVIAAVDFALVG
jgi:hypothetical protein